MDITDKISIIRLDREDLSDNPFDQFKIWLKQAVEHNVTRPDTMILSTCGSDKSSSSRVMYLRDIDEKGLIFFSKYISRKALQISQNPTASMLFLWTSMGRQVRIEGEIERTSKKESDIYFRHLSRNEQITACISPQSNIIDCKEELEDAFYKFRLENYSIMISRPDTWGAYRLIPKYFEFFQEHEKCLNDRCIYKLKRDNSWEIIRIAP